MKKSLLNIFSKIIRRNKKSIETPTANLLEKVDFLIHPTSLFTNSTIGKYSYISPNAIIDSCTIGKYCSIGPSAIIGFGDHPTNYLSTSPVFYFDKPIFNKTFCNKTIFEHHKQVIIENDVWIGANVYIKNGVKISNGAIVAAGSIVLKDVPPYAIVGGVPAKIIKLRFKDSLIKKMLSMEWWNYDDKILSTYSRFFNIEMNEEVFGELIETMLKNQVHV